MSPSLFVITLPLLVPSLFLLLLLFALLHHHHILIHLLLIVKVLVVSTVFHLDIRDQEVL